MSHVKMELSFKAVDEVKIKDSYTVKFWAL